MTSKMEEMERKKLEVEGMIEATVKEGKAAEEKMATLNKETKEWQDFGPFNIFMKGGMIGAVIAAHYGSGGDISRSLVWFIIAVVCLVVLASGGQSFVQLTIISEKYDKMIKHMNIIIGELISIEHECRGANISEVFKSKLTILRLDLIGYGRRYQRFVNIFVPRFIVVVLVVINLGVVLSLCLLTPSTNTTTPVVTSSPDSPFNLVPSMSPTPVPAVSPIVPPIPSPPNVPAMFVNNSAPVPVSVSVSVSAPIPAPAPAPKGSLSFGKALSLIVLVLLFVWALYYVANGGKFEFLTQAWIHVWGFI